MDCTTNTLRSDRVVKKYFRKASHSKGGVVSTILADHWFEGVKDRRVILHLSSMINRW